MNTIYGSEASPADNPKSFNIALNADHQVTFTFKDPFGLIEASTEGFTLPEELKGQFTSMKEAQSAVSKYLTVNPKGPIKEKISKKAI